MTPKFNAISVEFSKRIGDPVATANLSGNFFNAASDRNSYVGRALMKYFNDTLLAVKGDMKMFIKMFPELVKFTGTITYSVAAFMNQNVASYTIVSPYLNLHRIIGGYDNSGNYFQVYSEEKFLDVLNNRHSDFVATATEPAIIQVNNKVYYFPVNPGGDVQNCYLQYVAAPLNPTAGDVIEYNDTYDSPFAEHHQDKIAMICEELWKIDRQETT